LGNTDIVGDVRRLIVFDLDGTLIDSRRDLADAANRLIQELGGRPLAEVAIGEMVGEGAALLVQRSLSAAGVPQTPVSLSRFLEIYDERLLMHTRAYSGIMEALRSVQSHVSLAVLTNKPVAPSERILTALHLRDFFDEVVGGDGPWPRKPDPTALVAMIERAGATPQTTLLVGDSIIDHETAARAAVRCCLAAYGFGYASLRGARSEDAWVAQSPDQLVQIFEQFMAGG
jgi:phosphoglycolate phosphatase